MVAKSIKTKMNQEKAWFNTKHAVIRLSLLLGVVCFLFGFNATASDVKSAKLLSTYQIKLDKYENFIVSQSAHFQTGVLTSPLGKILIVAKDHVPQSVDSVKIRAQEDGVSPNSIKILKWKDRALFYYETPSNYHVYSTAGGHLLISKKTKFTFDFSKLSLQKKFNKKVAKL